MFMQEVYKLKRRGHMHKYSTLENYFAWEQYDYGHNMTCMLVLMNERRTLLRGALLTFGRGVHTADKQNFP
jgi:hypothetical protein